MSRNKTKTKSIYRGVKGGVTL